MDGQRFDELTRALAAGVSRRRILGIVGGVAALGAALGRRPAQAQPGNKSCSVGCGSLKGQLKNACMQACRECGGDFDRVCPEEGPFGPTGFTCCPPDTFCAGGGVCCPFETEPCFGPGGVTCCPDGTFCNFATGECQPFVA